MSQVIRLSNSSGSETSAQTVGATTANAATINLGSTPTTFLIEAKIAGFESTTPSGCGYNLICSAKTTGSVATIIGTQDKYIAEDSAISGCDGNFTVSGNSVIVVVKGSTGLTINWKVSTTSIGV